jgi:hypothetical protein
MDAYHNLTEDDMKPAIFAKDRFRTHFATVEAKFIYVRFAARTGRPCKFYRKIPLYFFRSPRTLSCNLKCKQILA